MTYIVPEWLEGSGRCVYDPPRPAMKNKKTKWWVVLDVDTEITRYYRWWADKEVLNPLGFDKGGLKQPAFDAHISVLRGEEPPADKMHLWRKHHNEIIPFRYRPIIRRSGDTTGWDRDDAFWFIDIDCPMLDDIRTEFGFRIGYKYHLTIGRLY